MLFLAGLALLSRAQEQYPVTFRLGAPSAQWVSVAGEFNGWDPKALPMSRGQDGTWTAATKLRAGDYAYKFIVDGRWQLDPAQPARKIVDHLENSRLTVGPGAPQPRPALGMLASALPAATAPATGAPAPASPAPQPRPVPTWNAAIYQQAATRYNSAVDAYQKYLGSRSNPAQLRTIADNLHGCVDDFEKIKEGAPAKYNVQRMIDRCNKLIFDIHSTMQVVR